MNDNILGAVIAGSSALLGALIPTLTGYLNDREQRKFEKQKALFDKQRQIYAELIISLQQIINSQTSTEDFLTLQRSVLQVSIYGDNATSKSTNDYYNAIILSTQPGSVPLTKNDHQNYQKQILNGMRSHLGLEPLPHFEIVSFRPNHDQSR
jgi:hypothetical protein